MEEDDGIIKWQKKTHDFGEIVQGKETSFKFEFENLSNIPVTILRVEPACGCTTSDFSEEPIFNGQTGYVTATYDGKQLGVFHKKISVIMDVGMYDIYIKGQVISKK